MDIRDLYSADILLVYFYRKEWEEYSMDLAYRQNLQLAL